MGDQGGDEMHEHEHSHDGDATHEHDHPKAALPADTKDAADANGNIDQPVLMGDEAQHNAPLSTAINAIKQLIAQELAEDECEFGCIIELCCVAQRLLSWAQGEAREELPGGDDYAAPMAMAPPTPSPSDTNPTDEPSATPTVPAHVTPTVPAVTSSRRLKVLSLASRLRAASGR